MLKDQDINTLDTTDADTVDDVTQASDNNLDLDEALEKAFNEAEIELEVELENITVDESNNPTTTETPSNNIEKATTLTTEPAAEVINAPHSWRKELTEDWAKIPSNAKKYILDRESQMQRAFTQIDAERKHNNDINSVIQAYTPFLQSKNLAPSEAVKEVLNLAYTFNTASPQDKAQIIFGLAKQHNLDLNQYVQTDNQQQEAQPNQQLNSMINQLYYENQTLKQQVNQVAQTQNYTQQAQQAQNLQYAIDDFAQNSPDFETVRQDMSNIIMQPKYANMPISEALNLAYQEALYINPTTREKLIGEQLKQKEQARITEMKARTNQAKQTAGSLKGSSGNQQATKSNKSLDQVLEETLNTLGYV